MVATLLAAGVAAADGYDPPAGYYGAATGSGATLKSQLASIMTTGQISRTYGDFRFSAAIHDADPDVPGNILLMYNRASVSGAWNSVNLPWNREHVWPQSQQGGGSASNSTTGHRGDPHALRPADPDINSARGNRPFGLDDTTGSYGPVGGTYYFPGDADKGDAARSLFYSATRYGASLGLSLTDGTLGANQMGDLSSLIKWHFADPPDDFERGRNHKIFSQAENPTYYTNNRNAYVDRPEFVWSVFVDQANDSRISIDGAAVGEDGSSTREIDLGRVFVGGSVPAAQTLMLNKSGLDGTYFEVTTTGAATSSLQGRHNAFRTEQTDSRSIEVGLNASTASSGIKTGTVTIDNLDVTASGGAGRGGNDANDSIDVSLAVLDHPLASFSFDEEQRERIIDFGRVNIGSGLQTNVGSIANLAAFGAPDFAAELDLDAIEGIGDTGAFELGVAPFAGLAQGDFVSFLPTFLPNAVGVFMAEYTLHLSDEDLPGEELQTLAIVLQAEAILSGDYNGDLVVDAVDYTVWRDNVGAPAGTLPNDADGGVIGEAQYNTWKASFGQSAGAASGIQNTAVPEPESALCAIAAAMMLAAWRATFAAATR